MEAKESRAQLHPGIPPLGDLHRHRGNLNTTKQRGCSIASILTPAQTPASSIMAGCAGGSTSTGSISSIVRISKSRHRWNVHGNRGHGKQ